MCVFLTKWIILNVYLQTDFFFKIEICQKLKIVIQIQKILNEIQIH